MSETKIHIHSSHLKAASSALQWTIQWTIQNGESWLLLGQSGSGKSMLGKLIAGLIAHSGEVQIANSSPNGIGSWYVDPWHTFTALDGVANFYYQQRYQAQQTKSTCSVQQDLDQHGATYNLEGDVLLSLLDIFHLHTLLGRQCLELSSGEHKKLQLLKALWLNPTLLVLDQPYTGLDKASRDRLNDLLSVRADRGGQLILICPANEMPSFITRVAQLESGRLNVLSEIPAPLQAETLSSIRLPDFFADLPVPAGEVLVKMKNIHVSYGDKRVLEGLNWEIKAGEKWLLQGPNGSGKSTLLSLISGDHPQSYANDISLFGTQRGTGESIWDIKARIGLISPELHWYYDTQSTVLHAVASGFYDSVGLFRDLSFSKQEKVNALLSYFGLDNYRDKALAYLPVGKQRLVLLARALIKNPDLLILDEPCQGLDEVQTRHFNQLIDELHEGARTLIYVSHDPEHLPGCLSHRLLLSAGKCVEQHPIYTQTTWV